MELKTAAKILFVVIVLVPSHPGVSLSETDRDIQEMQTITDFSYHADSGDSLETARALTLFGAKYKAVLWSAEHLAGRELLQDYGDKQREVFCLVADELQSRIIDESFSKKNSTYTIKIKIAVSLRDFVRAEIRNPALKSMRLISWIEQPDRGRQFFEQHMANQPLNKTVSGLNILKMVFAIQSYVRSAPPIMHRFFLRSAR